MKIELVFRCRVCQRLIEEIMPEHLDSEKQVRQLLLLRNNEIRIHVCLEGLTDTHRGIADFIGCNLIED